jgi:hypothetical protein
MPPALPELLAGEKAELWCSRLCCSCAVTGDDDGDATMLLS